MSTGHSKKEWETAQCVTPFLILYRKVRIFDRCYPQVVYITSLDHGIFSSLFTNSTGFSTGRSIHYSFWSPVILVLFPFPTTFCQGDFTIFFVCIILLCIISMQIHKAKKVCRKSKAFLHTCVTAFRPGWIWWRRHWGSYPPHSRQYTHNMPARQS